MCAHDVDKQYVPGVNIPAEIGMAEEDIFTPALVVDLDAFEHNVAYLKDFCQANNTRHRAHAKTHKSVDIARFQIEKGGAIGVCCQKVSEARVFVAGGINDVLVSNQVVDPRQIDLLARLATRATIGICVDDADNVNMLGEAAARHGSTISCLVEIDVGSGRCGVPWGEPALVLAEKIASTKGLKFDGLQAYHGKAQHVRNFKERRQVLDEAISQTSQTVDLLASKGLTCETVGGAGTGTYYFEAVSGVFNELQCGSYVFMDADYQKVRDKEGKYISEFRNSLFVHTTIMSTAPANGAVCDAGLKALAVDSGLPVVFGRDDLELYKCSDEHGQISDPVNSLKLNDKIKLVPGHCDPTCNLYDWYVGVRNHKVECLWPVSARGRVY